MMSSQVVTDRGKNMHFADDIPSLYDWIPCCDHIIDTMLTTIIDKSIGMVEGKKSAPFYEFY